VVLERGRKVRLRFQPPAGMDHPDGFLPQVFFPELAWRVEMMWQPENLLRLGQPDFNMLNVQPTKEDAEEFEFRLPRESRDFVVGVYQPGWLRYYKAGPFSRSDFTDNMMTLELPQPASITANLEWGDTDVADLPLKGVGYRVMWQLQEGGNSYASVASEQRTLDDASLNITDLAPGHYMLQLYTEPNAAAEVVASGDINPARFMARKMIELEAGEKVSEKFHYVPFNPNVNQGERTARVRVIGADGLSAAGKPMKVKWFDGHYGSLTIFDGAVPDDGVVVLEGISDEVPTEVPFGPYSVEVDGEGLGFFRVTADTEPQDFEFRLAPKVGDLAPDLELVALDTGERLRLEALRGKIVFLEFWETGCGPCQPEMAKLNELMSVHGHEWEDSVAVVPVSLDSKREIIAAHVASRGWTNLRHYWSTRGSDEYFSDVARAYVVLGVPTALLINREGEILWRGHPASFDLAEEVAKHRVE
jgi:thiol-disulfide isomerase/thioredoxin